MKKQDGLMDTINLSQFINTEKAKLERDIARLEQSRLQAMQRLHALPDFEKRRRFNFKRDPKVWPLKEDAGDFSQSLDSFVFYSIKEESNKDEKNDTNNKTLEMSSSDVLRTLQILRHNSP
jgi:hypothetical protein